MDPNFNESLEDTKTRLLKTIPFPSFDSSINKTLDIEILLQMGGRYDPAVSIRPQKRYCQFLKGKLNKHSLFRAN